MFPQSRQFALVGERRLPTVRDPNSSLTLHRACPLFSRKSDAYELCPLPAYIMAHVSTPHGTAGNTQIKEPPTSLCTLALS
jgi:hypothetical protein